MADAHKSKYTEVTFANSEDVRAILGLIAENILTKKKYLDLVLK